MQITASDLAFTDIAYEVLETEMKQRGMSVSARVADEVSIAGARSFQQQTLKAHWRGEARLASAYWLIYVGGSWIIGALVVLVGNLAPQLLLLAFTALFAFAVFAAVSVWRCAKNTSWVGWGYIARGVVVVTTAYLALIVFGLVFGPE